MRGPEDEDVHELVIIKRRRGEDEEAHHGGVWKIAYADFMTAMMAFFLVMWLINAANEETRSQVASYFNPVKLIDSRTNTRGLQDLESGADGQLKHEPVTGKSKSETTSDKSETENLSKEEALFRDPYKVLADIAGPQDQGPQPQSPGATDKQGRKGGEAFLDPFDPQTWQHAAEAAPVNEASGAKATDATIQQDAKADAAISLAATPPPEPIEPKAEAAKGAAETPPADLKAPDVAKAKNSPDKTQAGEIEKEIADALGETTPGTAPHVEVKRTREGVLISLTDDAHFGMFAIASAEPQPVLVQYLEKIGKILKTQPGQVIISGHTDARPFRSDTYDNWRLSSARAQMAYYMLVRGGIDGKRVERIEGHADRDLKIPGDPEAAENRRIEILLRETNS
ncbi:MotB family protein [soil metagenome]